MNWQAIVPIICGAAVLIAFLSYIYLLEPFNFQLSSIRINISLGRSGGKPKKLFTVLHLSDFHLRKSFKGKRLFRFIQTLTDREYDFIFITGDMVESIANAGYLAEMMEPLKAKYGKYAILGVHDHYNKALYEFARNMFKRKRKYNSVNDVGKLARLLKSSGIEVLVNESKRIKLPVKGMEVMELIGLDDPVIEKLDIGSAFKSIDPLDDEEIVDDLNFSDIEKDVFAPADKNIHFLNRPGTLRLVLLHTPDAHVISTLYNKGADVMLAGHTHGGQVRLPLVGAIISGCRLKTKYASGLFYFKKLVLFVSRGLGEGKYSQFRCYCPPEAVQIEFYGE